MASKYEDPSLYTDCASVEGSTVLVTRRVSLVRFVAALVGLERMVGGGVRKDAERNTEI